MAVINIQNVIFFHGINQLRVVVQNVNALLVEKKLKKGIQVQCVECDFKEEPQS